MGAQLNGRPLREFSAEMAAGSAQKIRESQNADQHLR
jgi:hypothetical protein